MGQVRLEVLRCGFCGSDLHARHGLDDWADMAAKMGYDHFGRSGEPIVFGHEFSGRVAEHGPGCRRDLSAGTPSTPPKPLHIRPPTGTATSPMHRRRSSWRLANARGSSVCRSDGGTPGGSARRSAQGRSTRSSSNASARPRSDREHHRGRTAALNAASTPSKPTVPVMRGRGSILPWPIMCSVSRNSSGV